jgi:hypothetical protein
MMHSKNTRAKSRGGGITHGLVLSIAPHFLAGAKGETIRRQIAIRDAHRCSLNIVPHYIPGFMPRQFRPTCSRGCGKIGTDTFLRAASVAAAYAAIRKKDVCPFFRTLLSVRGNPATLVI